MGARKQELTTVLNNFFLVSVNILNSPMESRFYPLKTISLRYNESIVLFKNLSHDSFQGHNFSRSDRSGHEILRCFIHPIGMSWQNKIKLWNFPVLI